MNNEIFHQFPGLKTFMNNMRKHNKHITSKNIYVFRSEDQDGNIVDEKYGVNLLTDIGLQGLNMSMRYYYGSDRPFTLLLYYTQIPDFSYEDDVLPTGSWIGSDITGYQVDNQVVYDSSTGFISKSKILGTCSFDYNISGITEDLQITAVIIRSQFDGGSGSSKYFPGTEIKIYDGTGEESSIVKRLNQRMTVHSIWTVSIHEDVISSAYNNHIYMCYNPGIHPARNEPFYGFIPNYYHNYTSRLANWIDGYARSTNDNTRATVSTSTGSIMQPTSDHTSEMKIYTNNSEMVNDPRIYYSQCETRLYESDNYTYAYFDIKLDDFETISCDEVYTDNIDTDSLLKSFAIPYKTGTNEGVLPVVDFTINQNGVKGYNYLTHDWDIDIPYVDAPNASYDNILNHSIPINLQDAPSTIYVHINKDTNIPITQLSKTSVSGDVYASDKYWDYSSYVQINDVTNIPQNLQTKRYYMTTNNIAFVNPTFDQQVHRLDLSQNHVVGNLPTVSTHLASYRPIPIFNKSCILLQDHIVFMDANRDVSSSFMLYGDSNDSMIDNLTIRYAFGDKLVVAPRNDYIPNNIRIYTISAVDTQPTYTDIPITFDNYDRIGTYTKSSNGFVVIHNEYDHEAYIIDVENETSEKLKNVSFCIALEYTDYCIYKTPNSSPQQFVIYDMKNKTIVDVFEIPETYTNLHSVFGMKNIAYICDTTNDVYNVFLYRINEKNMMRLTWSDAPAGMPHKIYPDTSNNWRIVHGNASQIVRPNGYIRTMSGNNYPTHTDIRYHDDGIIFTHASWTTSVVAYKIIYDNPESLVSMFKNEDRYQDKPIPGLDNIYQRNSYVMPNIASPSLDLIETEDKKRVLMYATGINYIITNNRNISQVVQNASNTYRSYVYDVGYMFDNNKILNGCSSHFSLMTADQNAIVYWNGGVITFSKTGDSIWRPLDRYLPHQITGQTKTIQVYNNPKSIGKTQMSWFITNRSNISSHTGGAATIGGLTWVKYIPAMDDRLPNKLVTNDIYGPAVNTISAKANDVVSLTVSGADPSTTFTWQLCGVNNRSQQSLTWQSQQIANGGSYTVPSNTNFLVFYISNESLTDGHWFMPWDISSVQITINGTPIDT